ncbi:sigma-70 family RNA polymerase sigma factor [Streptomyces hundungensis]|uniref:sigma-70 family RNA polymerase sigma factor n=1 Tax=Streptomyces hundungensis TaxID=1077946 RepID=UPI0031E4F709
MISTGTRPLKHSNTLPDTCDAFAELAVLCPGTRRDGVRDRVIEAWLPFSRRVALRYRQRGEATEDLCQVAALGLVKAVDGYDIGRGPFLAYAMPMIKGEIRHHFRDHSWGVHIPRRIQELRNRVRLAYQELQAEGPQEPAPARIAARTGLNLDEVGEALEALHGFTMLSLDAPHHGHPGADYGCLGDTLADSDADRGFGLVLDRETVRPGLEALTLRESRILYLRFYEDMTQARIGRELGISQEQVCRVLARICSRLRELTGDGASSSIGPSAPVGPNADPQA